MKTLNWRKNIEEARTEVSGGTRLLMLFFHDVNDEGSKKTIDEVFKDDRVIEVIERECAPVRYDINKDQKVAANYGVDWTPTFVIADEQGRMLEKWVGYLPSEEFICQLELSKGLAEFHLGRYEEAEREFGRLIDEHPESAFVPEAEYYLGVTKYKETGDHLSLGQVCSTLTEKFPDSPWTKKCSVWSHLVHARRSYVAFDQGGATGSGAY